MNDYCNKGWPMLLDMTKQECKQSLRALELSAYSQLVSVLRAQGEFTKEKKKLLQDLQAIFSISLERHRAEVRRAVNDEILYTIADKLAGPNTQVEWSIEGRRLIPLLKRVPPQIAYTALATRMAQVYCGFNAKAPKPCETSRYGKLQEVGADSELTDSEDETQGLRFIADEMVPKKFNPLQGSYTTLPLSQTRVAKEKIKNKQVEKQADKELKDESSVDEGSPLSSPPLPPPPPPHATDKKRKHISVDNEIPLPPHSSTLPPHSSTLPPHSSTFPPHSSTFPPHSSIFPPPAPITPGVTQASSLLNFHHSSSIRQLPTVIQPPPMKISVPGPITSTRCATTSITTPINQKVILVSTTASSTPVYQQRINIPILKSSTQTSLGALSSVEGFGHQNQPNPNVLKGLNSAAIVSPTVLSGGSSLASKIRPRFSSMTSSILSQGSSSLPGLPPRPTRQRSNSLILHAADGHPSFSSITKKEGGILPRVTSGPTILPDSSSGGPLNFLGSSNLQHLRGSTAIGTAKTGIQVRPDGTIITGTASSMSGVYGNRMIGRTTPTQGVYMVSTNAGGTITVVTRTVASASSMASPRVVTVNTVSNVRSSVVRGPASTTVVSMGKPIQSRQPTTGNVKPIIGCPKSNVIVVHKGAIPNTPRPVQGLRPRELSTKIFTKSMGPGIPGTSNIINTTNKLTTGLLTGTLVVKPSAVAKSVSITSSKDDLNTNVQGEISSGPATNVLVLDFNQRTPSPTTAVTLASIVQHPSHVRVDDGKKDTMLDSPIVSASSSLPVFKVDARPMTDTTKVLSIDEPSEHQIMKDYSEISSSGKRSLSDDDDPPTLRRKKRSPGLVNEADDDNEWCKLGLELDEEALREDESGEKIVAGDQSKGIIHQKEGEIHLMVENVDETLDEAVGSGPQTILHEAGYRLLNSPSREINYTISNIQGIVVPAQEDSQSSPHRDNEHIETIEFTAGLPKIKTNEGESLILDENAEMSE